MRVEYNTLDEILSDLATVTNAGGRVIDRAIRVRIDRVPEQDEAVTHRVAMWVTAVVDSDGGGRWLAEFCDICGRDTPKSPAGSDTAEDWYRRVVEAAEAMGLEVRPGKIEVF